MDRRTFITTSTAAAVGLASNAISTTHAQGKKPRPTSPEGFWPNKARLVISLSMQFETGAQPDRGAGSPFTTMERHVLAKAQQSLRPELYARIAEKLVFNRLSYEVQMEIARLHIGRELSFLRGKGFHLTAGHAVVSFLMQRGFHPRLGARPLRDTIKKHLRGAVADATLAEVSSRTLEFVVSANELILRPC